MKLGSGDRYFQSGTKFSKLVPEGIEGMVPYRGPVKNTVHQLIGGLRSSMGYCGCKTIKEFGEKIFFCSNHFSGSKENHPHEVKIIKRLQTIKYLTVDSLKN